MTGRVAVHRRLGIVAAVLIPIMTVTGLLTAMQGARDGWNPAPPPGPYQDSLSFMIVGVEDFVTFTGLVCAGLAMRRRADVHKRLMVLGTLGGLSWPAITRMPIVSGRLVPMFALRIMLVLAPAVRDFWRGSRARWVSLFVGLGILATFPLRVLIGSTPQWRAFAAWLIQ